jgi:hypothetical protein
MISEYLIGKDLERNVVAYLLKLGLRFWANDWTGEPQRWHYFGYKLKNIGVHKILRPLSEFM